MVRTSFIIVDRPADLGEAELRSRLAVIRDHGYAGAEFQLTRPAGVDLDRLEGWLREYDLRIPSFLTGEAYGEGLCLSSPDAAVRRATVDRLIGYLPVVKRFGAVMVVGLLQGRRSDEPDAGIALARIADGLTAVAAAAAAAGVEVVIEPVNHLQAGFNNSVAEVLALIERLGSPAVRPMVDTIHMNIEEDSLVAPIRACGRALRHVHLCESHGGRLGTGRIDFPAVLQALAGVGYQGWQSVKVYRKLGFAEAVATSMDYLRSLGVSPRGE
jgi:D-psicose/D-tagatose/L-ribulose 3-epimerase